MNDITKACKLLKSGQVVGMPTETVYGLAGLITSPEGIENIFKTKERPFFDPLIVHVSDLVQAKAQAKYWYPVCDLLAKHFWPGPLTMILPKADHINTMITSGLDTVGIRMPNHPIALDLIKSLGTPVAAPSANKFKKTSPTRAEHVSKEFNDLYVLDGGPCEIGIESTVLGVFENEIKIYRPGMLTKSKLETFLSDHGMDLKVTYQESPVAPGHLKHHYMPNLPIALFWGEFNGKESLSQSNIPKEKLEKINHWKLPTDPNVAARELYEKFRSLDSKDASLILLELDPMVQELEDWKGILNRIDKAKTFVI
jgi:L-threonylcarbamoyladenylate synthase